MVFQFTSLGPTKPPAGALEDPLAAPHRWVDPRADLPPDPRAVPDIVVYGDGRVFYPEPDFSRDRIELQVVHQTRISASVLSQLLEDARAAGLLEPAHADLSGGQCPIPASVEDSSTSGCSRYEDVVVADAAATHEFYVGGQADGLPGEQARMRAAIDGIRSTLVALIRQDASSTYPPDELAVYVKRPFERVPDDAQPTPWPLDRPLASGGDLILGPLQAREERVGGYRCLPVTSKRDVDTLMRAAAAKPTPDGLWSDDGKPWIVVVRPLLPDEHTCPGTPVQGLLQRLGITLDELRPWRPDWSGR